MKRFFSPISDILIRIYFQDAAFFSQLCIMINEIHLGPVRFKEQKDAVGI